VQRVFHFAAQVAVTTSLRDPFLDFDVNARGTLNLLEAIRALEDRPSLLFTSTNKVYGHLDDVALRRCGVRYEPEDAAIARRGISESRPLDFHSPYGCSKGAAEQYVLDYARTFDLPAAVFRMSCIYGPHQFGTEDQGWVAHFLIQALKRQPLTLYGDGLQVRDILFAGDLVDAMLLAHREIRRIGGEAFNIGGGPSRTVSLLELLDLMRELLGDRAAVDIEPWRPADQRYYVSDTAKFEAATGWRPTTSVRAGVTHLLEWLMESGAPLPRDAFGEPVPS
jgi:CDP-paratose 2-epimerase